MKATAGRTPGYIEFEYIIPAAQQRQVLAKVNALLW
jgi:hypothetical protein